MRGDDVAGVGREGDPLSRRERRNRAVNGIPRFIDRVEIDDFRHRVQRERVIGIPARNKLGEFSLLDLNENPSDSLQV